MQDPAPRDGLRTDGGATTPDPYQPPEYDVRWNYRVHLEDDSYRFDLQTKFTSSIDPTIDTLVADLYVPSGLPDPRAQHHWKWTPLNRWVRAHILREARGLTIKGLHEYLEDHPYVAADLGFLTDEYEGFHEDTPGYTNLRDMWKETFTSRLQGACKVLAERLVHLARDHGLPAPDDVFVPDEDVEADDVDEDDPTVRELTIDKTADVWEHIRPLVDLRLLSKTVRRRCRRRSRRTLDRSRCIVFVPSIAHLYTLKEPGRRPYVVKVRFKCSVETVRVHLCTEIHLKAGVVVVIEDPRLTDFLHTHRNVASGIVF